MSPAARRYGSLWADQRVALNTRPRNVLSAKVTAYPPHGETPVVIDLDTLIWLAELFLIESGWHQNTDRECWSKPPRAAGLSLGQALDVELAS
jgi:hypothetical protein